MSPFSRHIALISNHEVDHLVFPQVFASHPDRLTLTCFTTVPDDLFSYGLVVIDKNVSISIDYVKYIMMPDRPLKIGALIDKIESLLFSSDDDGILMYRDYVLKHREMRLQLGNEIIPMTERETEILTMLMRAGDEGCRREDMLTHIWGYRTDLETHTLETHIYRLRQKIEDQPNDPLRLVTIDNGYRLD